MHTFQRSQSEWWHPGQWKGNHSWKDKYPPNFGWNPAWRSYSMTNGLSFQRIQNNADNPLQSACKDGDYVCTPYPYWQHEQPWQPLCTCFGFAQ